GRGALPWRSLRMTSLYPPLASRSPLLPGPQAPGTQKAQDGGHRRRLLLSCHLQDLLSAGTSVEPNQRPLITEKLVGPAVEQPVSPGLVDAQNRARFAERRVVRDPAERKASLRRVAAHSWTPAELPEPSLQQQPLLLLGEEAVTAGPTARFPRLVLWDESRRCFASHWPGALSPDFCRQSFGALLTHGPWEALHSKKGQVTRETCWYVRKGCRCDYTYGIARVRAKRKQTKAFHCAMEMLLEELMRVTFPQLPKEAWPNAANLNLYSEKWQSIGWHADDESLFQGRDKDCPIISVSLGAPREFWLALRHEGNCMDPKLKSIVEVDLSYGDILTMEGLCQKYCVHFVPADLRNVADAQRGSRINVTWRWIREHKQRCPQHVDGVEEFFFGAHGIPRSPGLPCWTSAWAGNLLMAWRACEECDHDAWRGGRNCVKHQQKWLCRHCYQHALSGAPARPKIYTPRERGQRRPQLPKDRQENSQETLNHGHFQSMGPSWFPAAGTGYLSVVDLVHFMPTFPVNSIQSPVVQQATQDSSEPTPQLAQSCQVPVQSMCAAKVSYYPVQSPCCRCPTP
ncbi:unnamed protein product, partial [Cladocopium goreaui]